MIENKISILITSFNKSKYIKKNLSKLISQNYKKYEIIIFDDHSTDNSVEIIKNFKKVKLIRNKKKKKNTPALCQIEGIKRAFKISTGNILCFLDADDFFKVNKLKNINNYFFRNKSKRIVYDMPLLPNNKNFKISSYNPIKIWPDTFPTSCISIRTKYFKFFLNYLFEKKFQNLEIDTRIMLFFKFYFQEYNVINKTLTIYNFDINGIMANIPKFSKTWWIRRNQAFEYLKLILKQKKVNFKFSFDYLITSLISNIIK